MKLYEAQNNTWIDCRNAYEDDAKPKLLFFRRMDGGYGQLFLDEKCESEPIFLGATLKVYEVEKEQ